MLNSLILERVKVRLDHVQTILPQPIGDGLGCSITVLIEAALKAASDQAAYAGPPPASNSAVT